MSKQTVLILGLGEGGAYLAQWLGSHSDVEQVLAYDTAITGPRADVLREKAANLGVELQETLADLPATVNIVFSLVPGHVAITVADILKPLLKAESIYVDLNSVTPATIDEIGTLLEASGIDLVDGSILGSFQSGGQVPVFLSGPKAGTIYRLLDGAMFEPTTISAKPGDASAVKMLRSVMMKGLEALVVESLVAAEAQGLRSAFIRALQDMDEQRFTSMIEVLAVTHLLHAPRRLGEIERVQAILQAKGVDDTMTEAARRVFSKTAADESIPLHEAISFDETVKMLCRIFADPS